MRKFIPFFILLLLAFQSHATTITSTTDGNWTSTGTWVGGVVPSAGDTVVIASNHEVTVDADSTCADLTINGATTFAFNRLNVNDGVTFTVTGDVELKSQGSTLGSYVDIKGAGIMTVGGSISFSGPASTAPSGILMNKGASVLNLAGSVTLGAGTETLSSGPTSKVNFNGSSAQTIFLNTTFVYSNITLNNSHGSGASLGAAVTTSNLTHDVTVESGIFSNAGFAMAGNTGEIFEVQAGATFLLTGSSTFPTGFDHVVSATSTIDYAGASQTIAALNNSQNYGHLVLSGTGNKTLAGAINIDGNFTLEDDTLSNAGFAIVGSASNNFQLDAGTVFILSGTSSFATLSDHVISATSTIVYEGTTQTVAALNNSQSYGNLIIAGSGTKTLGGAIDHDGDLTIQSGTLDNGGFAVTGAGGENFEVQSGATYLLTGTTSLPTGADHVFASGSTIHFGGGSQTIGIPGNSQDYSNLTISGTGTKSLGGGANRNVTGTLDVQASTLALGTGSDEITLVSTASATARLANLAGTITGTQLTVQRYLTSNNNYRLLSAALPGQIIDNWDDEIITSGYTGSAGSVVDDFVSIYSYDETHTGVVDSGWTSPTDSSDALTVGRGFLVWVQQTPDTTISITGAPNTGTVVLPISYTDGPESADDDGWNLLGNPFASAIDLNNCSFTGVDSVFYILDPASGSYASWSAITNTGTLGATGIVGHSQGFWVHATAAAAFSVPQTAKTDSVNTTFFKEGKTTNELAITFSTDSTTTYDQGIVRMDPLASLSYDNRDNKKLPSMVAGNLTIMSSDMEDLSVSSIPELNGDSVAIPVKVSPTMKADANGDYYYVYGTYELAISGISTFPLNAEIILEDLREGTMTPITSDEVSYEFTILMSDNTANPRFQLHIIQDAYVTNNQTVVVCEGESTVVGSSTYNVSGVYTDLLSTAGGVDSIVTTNLIVSAPITTNQTVTLCAGEAFKVGNNTYTATGNYTDVLTSAVSGCDSTVTTNLVVESSIADEVTVYEEYTLVANQAGASYQWIDCSDNTPIDGENGQFFVAPGNGEYAVVITQNGCSATSDCYVTGVNSVEAIDDETIDKVKVYPNPFKETTTISVSSEISAQKLIIYDAMARPVKEARLQGNKYNLIRGELPSGVYYFNVFTANDHAVARGKLIIN